MGEDRSRKLWPAAYVASFFFCVGVGLFIAERAVGHLVFFGLIGVATGMGLWVHARARKKRRAWGRKISLAVIGLSLALGAGVFGRQSFQLEGFFFHVLAGVAGGVVVHYLVAKILGPLFIGRAFCGWGCWIWMVLDYLPWKRPAHHPVGAWPWLRVAHFAASLGLVALLVYVVGYDHGFEWTRTDGLWWFLGGTGAYLVAGVALAWARKDNRSFCKLLCPVTVFNRAAGRLSLLKVRGDRDLCNDCGACDELCPMDVPVSRYVLSGKRVLDAECTLCQTCVAACPRTCLGLSLGFDVSLGRPRDLRRQGA